MNRFIFLFILILAFAGCNKNHAPEIIGLTCSPDGRSAGTTFTIQVNASDEDGDSLSYLWKADSGSFTTATNTTEVKWKSPIDGAGKNFTLNVRVSDGQDNVSQDFNLLLGEPQLGSLVGVVNYTNFKIPIPEVVVSVGDRTALTNSAGQFTIAGIPADSYTLTAGKENFTFYSAEIRIIPNDTVRANLEITSANYTTKLSGKVSNQDGQTVENARIVVLNPDGSESKLMTTTNSVGYYRLWYIPFGSRTVVITKSETEDSRYVENKETVSFEEIELQLNLTLQVIPLRGQFTDQRDSHIYQYKTIGTRTWMTENLAYLPKVSPSATISSQDAIYYVYGYQGSDTSLAKATANYKQYGVLYNRPAALKACPPGWYLPTTDQDWNVTIELLEPKAGRKMKSQNGWRTAGGGGDNSSGFSVLPGGEVRTSGVFAELGNGGYFWSSSVFYGIINCKGFIDQSDVVFSLPGSEGEGLSVRCVRDR